MNCYTISSSYSFLSTLAQWVMDEYGHKPEILTKTRILLPGRRACRSLQEAFLAQSKGRPLLLPKIEPIGDIVFQEYHASAPVITPLRRQLLLTRLIANFESQRQGKVYNMEKAVQLAGDLARFMDEVAREELDYSALEKLVPEELERHWQQTLDFLTIISKYWPKLLEEEGVGDPASSRNQEILALAAHWKKNEPNYPVIAAGSTGSQPATAQLLITIAGLTHGKVVLPGLDTQMEQPYWDVIEETHPQFLLKQLLERMEYPRGKVKPLVGAVDDTALTVCMRQLFAPAAITANWKEADIPLAEGFSHMRVMEAGSELEEARVIGALLREALETPGKTAALITPDRVLARLVSAQMKRYGVDINDSAGRCLKTCPTGVYMGLINNVLSSRAAPADLLALLRHPLASAGLEPAQCRELSRKLEILLLRGVRMQSGIGTLREEAEKKQHDDLAEFLRELEIKIQPLATLFSSRESVPFSSLLTQHIEFAQWLASTPSQAGEVRLWEKESGNQVATWLSELLEHSSAIDRIDPFIYPATFDALMAGQSYWSKQAAHPRLHILSPIEARLQQYDLVILGGMNEHTWPASTMADPWMSRPMRQSFGLPLPERSVGQSAHDVYMASFAPQLVCTRARKVAGMPTIASRWLIRLKTLVGEKDAALYAKLVDSSYHDATQRVLEAVVPCGKLEAPAPDPGADARPKHLSVTQIDKWLADPYVIYARYILGLRRLEDLDREPSAADFGNLVHEALQVFVTRYPGELPAQAENILLECGWEVFGSWLARPAIRSLWWPRFESLACWFIAQETKRRKHGDKVVVELRGRWEMCIDGKSFTLVTRIDRLELRQDNSLALIDYKTGSVPKISEIQKGQKNQLPLEALVMQYGTLETLPELKNSTTLFEYWKLGNHAQACEILPMPLAEPDIEKTRHMLESLIRQYDTDGAVYAAQTDSRLQLDYNHYEHFTRRKEWQSF